VLTGVNSFRIGTLWRVVSTAVKGYWLIRSGAAAFQVFCSVELVNILFMNQPHPTTVLLELLYFYFCRIF
jgi:hypothetical protein